MWDACTWAFLDLPSAPVPRSITVSKKTTGLVGAGTCWDDTTLTLTKAD